MTNSELNEARVLIASLGSIHKAAKHLGIPYSTLRRQLQKGEQAESESEPEPQAAPEVEPWRTIRMHKNDTRKQLGLPPLTEAEWAEQKAAMQECMAEQDRLLPQLKTLWDKKSQ